VHIKIYEHFSLVKHFKIIIIVIQRENITVNVAYHTINKNYHYIINWDITILGYFIHIYIVLYYT